ncbi:Protein of unknown function [Bacillus wiedmannii]|uniref:Uncharacterized protein n=1 Tax=Bacillus wiedmannii TaxID=1890302 RepID=A0A1C6WI73_9BACI|nr:Protein of unknown function [Bacillus wiedmannii]SCL87779.1 Protein of unknown function [Bacillus wiedmannii]
MNLPKQKMKNPIVSMV